LSRANPSPEQKLTEVSVIQLIATPEKFDGRRVAVFGFLALKQEDPVLWLHKEDADNYIIPNALWIFPSDKMRLDASAIDGKYVTVTGIFHAYQFGAYRRAGQNGAITSISECKLWSDPNHPVGTQYNSHTK
jgi:hypothetical protein